MGFCRPVPTCARPVQMCERPPECCNRVYYNCAPRVNSCWYSTTPSRSYQYCYPYYDPCYSTRIYSYRPVPCPGDASAAAAVALAIGALAFWVRSQDR